MQVVIQKIPENLQEFEILAAKGRKPEHICALFLCALALFDRDKDAGTAAMNLLRGPRPMTPYDAQFLRDRLRGKPYLSSSLITRVSRSLRIPSCVSSSVKQAWITPSLRTP